MKYVELTRLVGGLACFELPLLVQAFPDHRPTILLQLSRWVKEGKVVPLRRGIYTLPDDTRRVALDPALLAQHLCKPSYLSGLWALGFHDMIPERVVVHTSVTTRLPARYENPYGVFEYRHIKPVCFFGYQQTPYAGSSLLVACPEKALLDHWYLTSGEWTRERIVEMRYQNTAKVDPLRLKTYAERCQRPRLERAVARWREWVRDHDDGEEIL